MSYKMVYNTTSVKITLNNPVKAVNTVLGTQKISVNIFYYSYYYCSTNCNV